MTAEASKVFHVSPFLPVEGHYRFRLSQPSNAYTASVSFYPDGHRRPQLVAIQSGVARRASDGGLLVAAALAPTMAFKVIVAIHWQALKLWLRGAALHRKPEPPTAEITE